ncbi:hypothetical protein CspeluHIS016_0201510 [Cutaneotrichosporon spelunceum]|uniref:DRMBL-domain-containing protein n=1 Tax=Cutaneotrichosporon spelunceum TaxID=1672016 RepID=A0AAD3TQR6_9TREE|nr:hypothetical protein CspeluHIS016_0201510 [Cutaneotrichosporon spelunceum]
MGPRKKPPISTSKNGSLLNFFGRTGSAGSPLRKGKRKADVGSAADPVVISDEDEPVCKQTRRASPEGRGRQWSSAEEDEAEEALVSECMICGMPLPPDTTSAEAHINACIDADCDPQKAGLIKVGPLKPGPSRPAKDPPARPSPASSPEVIILSPESTPREVSPPQERIPNAKGKERDKMPRPITSVTHSLRTEAPPPSKANAFSVLMLGNKDKETWDEVDQQKNVPGRRRPAPFYKVLTGMPISVDAFCYGAIPGVNAYFLTHNHSDHYTNLSKSWQHGPIYCSETTANLVVLMLGVEPQWVHGIPDNEPFIIPNTGGVTVTLIEANHCPGSSIFLFEGRQTAHAGDSSFRSPYVGSKRVFRYLHCGDFRACPKHVLHPAVARAPLDTIYLDTTYLNPQYCFPPQPLVIAACAELAKKIAFEDVDIKPKVEAAEASGDASLDAEMPGEFEMLPDEGNVKPQTEDEDIKLEIYEECPEEEYPQDFFGEGDVDPGVNGEGFKSDDDPDVKPDIKPDVKPHPAAMAYDILERSVSLMEGWLKKHPSKEGQESKPKGRVLVLVGTYSIGKERIVKAIAQALDSKIYADERKRSIIRAQDDPELHAMMGDDPRECQVHIVPLWNVQRERAQSYLEMLQPHFERVLAFRPTGWTFRASAGANTLPDVNFVIKRDQARGFSDISLQPVRGSSRQFMIFGVPYSEHSSFFELTCFSLSTPGNAKIIATVNVHSERSRQAMRKWFERWAAEKARRKERGLPAVVEYRNENYW